MSDADQLSFRRSQRAVFVTANINLRARNIVWNRIATPPGLESAGPASHASLGLRPISANLAGTVLHLELVVDLDVGCQ